MAPEVKSPESRGERQDSRAERWMSLPGLESPVLWSKGPEEKRSVVVKRKDSLARPSGVQSQALPALGDEGACALIGKDRATLAGFQCFSCSSFCFEIKKWNCFESYSFLIP